MAEFNTKHYESAWGAKPRGHGHWAFAPARSLWPADVEMPEDGLAWAFGTYSEAKRDVRRAFPSVDAWEVMS
jgi:hypothetical protein